MAGKEGTTGTAGWRLKTEGKEGKTGIDSNCRKGRNGRKKSRDA